MVNESKKPARAEREWLARHEALLDAATDLFLEHGFNGTTMQMVAEQAEFSVGYLYKHFGSKESVRDEVLSRHLRRYEALRRDIRSDMHRSPLERYRAEIEAVTRHMAGHPGLLSVLLQPHQDLPAWVHVEFRRHRREDTELVAEAQAAGELPAGDPALLAAALTGAIRSLFQTLTLSGREAEVARIPEFVEQYVLLPMIQSILPVIGKDPPLP